MLGASTFSMQRTHVATCQCRLLLTVLFLWCPCHYASLVSCNWKPSPLWRSCNFGGTRVSRHAWLISPYWSGHVMKGRYVIANSETCKRRLKSDAKRSLSGPSAVTWKNVQMPVWLMHTLLLAVISSLEILPDILWQPHTVEEASEDKHWFQTNLLRHLLFLVRYTFPLLMSSHLYSLPSKMFFFSCLVSGNTGDSLPGRRDGGGKKRNMMVKPEL